MFNLLTYQVLSTESRRQDLVVNGKLLPVVRRSWLPISAPKSRRSGVLSLEARSG